MDKLQECKFRYLQDARLDVKSLILKGTSQNHKSAEWNILCFESLENIVTCFLFNSPLILLQMLIWWFLREKILCAACPLKDGLGKALCRILKVFSRKEILLHHYTVTYIFGCVETLSRAPAAGRQLFCLIHWKTDVGLEPVVMDWKGCNENWWRLGSWFCSFVQ